MKLDKLFKTVIDGHQVDKDSIIAVAKHARDVYEMNIPQDKNEIKSMSEGEMVTAVQKLNMFSGLSPNDAEWIQDLYDRAIELWGTPPSSIKGQWVELCLWHHARAATNGSDVGWRPTLDESTLKQYHQDRSDTWKRQIVETTERYDSPDEVPDRARDVLIPTSTA